MADISRKITLTAELDATQLKKQIADLKKEMQGAMMQNPAQGASAALGKNGGKGAAAITGKFDVSNMHVENMYVTNLVIKNSNGAGVPGVGPSGGSDGGGSDKPVRGSPTPKSFLSQLGRSGALAAAATAVTAMATLPGALTERRNRATYLGISGDQLNSIATRNAQTEGRGLSAVGGIGGAGAGAAAGAALGSFLGPLGTAVGAVGGGLYGAYKGYTATEDAQVLSNKQQIEAVDRAYKAAQGLNPSAVQAMRGGNLSGNQINSNLMYGGNLGLNPDETLNNFISARGALGNKAAQESFGGIQKIGASTGADTGSIASFLETFRGAGKTSANFASGNQVRILENAFSKGLDMSKTSKFLQTSTDLMNQTVGMSVLNAQGSNTNLLNLAGSLANGGPLTDTVLNQAQTLAQRQAKESMSTEGFSGLGNVLSMQDFQKNSATGKTLGGSDFATLLKTQTGEDPKEILELLKNQGGGLSKGLKSGSVSEDQALTDISNLLIAKGNARGSGLGKLGSLGSFVGSMENGESALSNNRSMQAGSTGMSENTLRAAYDRGALSLQQYQKASGFSVSDTANSSQLMPSDITANSSKIGTKTDDLTSLMEQISATPQGGYQKQEAQKNSEIAVTGFTQLDTATKQTALELENFKDAIKDATVVLRQLSGEGPSIVISRDPRGKF